MARDFSSTIRLIGVVPTTFPVTAWPITMGAWIKNDNTNATVFAVADASTSDDWILIGTRGLISEMKCDVKTAGSATAILGTTAIATADWSHIALVVRGDADREIYLNGVSEGMVTTPSKAFPNNLDRIGVGGIPDTAFIDAGGSHYISDVALWDTDLSVSELLALTAGASPQTIRRGSLKTHVPLWGEDAGGTGGSEVDLVTGEVWALLNTGTTPPKVDHAPVGRSVTPAPPYNLSPNVNQIGTISGSVQIAGRALIT